MNRGASRGCGRGTLSVAIGHFYRLLDLALSRDPDHHVSPEAMSVTFLTSVPLTAGNTLPISNGATGFPWWLSIKNLPACRSHRRLRFHPWVRKIPLEESMASHSSILAWRIPRTEEPGRLQSMELQRIRHDWSDWAHTQKDWARRIPFASYHLKPLVSSQDTYVSTEARDPGHQV